MDSKSITLLRCSLRSAPARDDPRRRAFTLIELLVVIAIIAVLVGLIIPALSRAREAGRAVTCLSNLRSSYIAMRGYADEHRGLSPAVGQPYTSAPNWAIVVQNSAGIVGESATEALVPRSVVVCPSATAFYARPMNRTYAINVTGLEGDPATGAGGFDDASRTTHIQMDKVPAGLRLPLLLDSAITSSGAPGSPPPVRTASVISFRIPEHAARIGRWHGAGRQFHWVGFDGAASGLAGRPEAWETPLP